MIDVAIWIWLAIFGILVLIHVKEKSYDFGMIAGVWLLFLSLFIITSGVQVQTGYTTTVVGDNSTVLFTYGDLTLPYTTYSFLWGLFLILVSLYMIIANATAKRKNKD